MRPPFIFTAAVSAAILTGIKSASATSPPIPLKVMPLGRVLTKGVEGSWSLLGWRRPLLEKAAVEGLNVTLVGDQREGRYPGDAYMLLKNFPPADPTLWEQKAREYDPDIIIIDMAHDICNRQSRWDQLPDAFRPAIILTNQLFLMYPRTSILLTKALMTRDPFNNRCKLAINAQFEHVETVMRNVDKRFMLADMRGEGAPGKDDMSYSVFGVPNDSGYQKIAALYVKNIKQILNLGWIRHQHPPSPPRPGMMPPPPLSPMTPGESSSASPPLSDLDETVIAAPQHPDDPSTSQPPRLGADELALRIGRTWRQQLERSRSDEIVELGED